MTNDDKSFTNENLFKDGTMDPEFGKLIESRVARFESRKYDWDALKFQADFDPIYPGTPSPVRPKSTASGKS